MGASSSRLNSRTQSSRKRERRIQASSPTGITPSYSVCLAQPVLHISTSHEAVRQRSHPFTQTSSVPPNPTVFTRPSSTSVAGYDQKVNNASLEDLPQPSTLGAVPPLCPNVDCSLGTTIGYNAAPNEAKIVEQANEEVVQLDSGASCTLLAAADAAISRGRHCERPNPTPQIQCQSIDAKSTRLTTQHTTPPSLTKSRVAVGSECDEELTAGDSGELLLQVCSRVTKLATNSRLDSGTVRTELERNRGELASYRGEVHEVGVQIQEMQVRTAIDILPVVPGASYGESLGCWEDTRTETIEEILDFLTGNEVDETRVLLLSGPAGCGKTAIAHSVAYICDQENSLGSSFFFKAGETLRDRPDQLVCTIARELSAQIPAYGSLLVEVLEKNPSIGTAVVDRQFRMLLLEPFSQLSYRSQPMAIVIDAIDEGWSEQLLLVIKACSKLPPWIRLFLTLRDDGSILPRLRSQTHIRSLAFEIRTESNLRDIEVYMKERLHTIAGERELHDWPTTEVVSRMCSKADGLFVWAAVACNSIADPDFDPMEQYEELVSNGPLRDTRVSTQMDELYLKVLSKCHLDEPRAFSRLHQCLGTLLALKRPLSSAGFGQLIDEKHVLFTLRPLASVIRGVIGHQSQSLQIIHHSFREFVTQESTDACFSQSFTILEGEYNGPLALRCLQLIRKEMPKVTEYTAWITDESRDADTLIPTLKEGVISEAFWYACEYVGEHISTVADTVLGLSDAFNHFLREDVYGWLAVSAMNGNCRGIEKIQEYIQRVQRHEDTVPNMASFAWIMRKLSSSLKFDDRLEEALIAARASVVFCRTYEATTQKSMSLLAGALGNLSIRLSDLGFREEALTVVRECVAIHRELARQRPATFNPSFATSLNNLSNRLSGLGQHVEALSVVRECIVIRRDLVRDRPSAFTPDLASSLNNLSGYLWALGQHERGLAAARESVILYRTLARQKAAIYSSELAISLNTLSTLLSKLGHLEEALVAIHECVAIRRDLAHVRPATFNPSLAISLNNLSNRLSELGRREDALRAVSECIAIRRALAKERPATINPDLATSLNNYSNHLSELGQHDEALIAVYESVAINRDLAKERPAAFNSNLARSLNNLSRWLCNLGRHDEAVLASHESVAIRRDLARNRPAVFNSDLALSLSNLSSQLSHLGYNEEALAAIQECVEIRRDLVKDKPARFLSYLAMSLVDLSLRLLDLGSHEDALIAVRESVDLYRILAKVQPGTFSSNLATSLNTLFDQLSTLGHHEDALAVAHECVVIRRKLATEQPVTFNADLALSLLNLAISLLIGEEGLREGICAHQEAEEVYRLLNIQPPSLHQSKWRAALNRLEEKTDARKPQEVPDA